MADNISIGSAESIMPGQILSQARQAKSWSQVDVAKKLHLKLAVIQNIEDNNFDYDAIPTYIYLRGYLRSYARLVGVPETEVLSAFDALNMHFETKKPRVTSVPYFEVPIFRQTHKKRKSSSKHWVSVWVFAAIVIAFFGWHDLRNHLKPAGPQQDASKQGPTVTIETSKNVQSLPLPAENK